MSYTVEDVDQLFSEGFTIRSHYGTSWESSGVEAWYDAKSGHLDDIPTRLGQLYYVDGFGGEGDGDQYWVVIRFVAPDGSERYFKRLGWYQSFSGGELDGPTIEVRPREKMVTVYE